MSFGQAVPERRLFVGERFVLRVDRRPALGGTLAVSPDGRLHLADGAAFPAVGGTLNALARALETRYGALTLARAPAVPIALPGALRLNLPPNTKVGDARRLFGPLPESILVLRADDREARVDPDSTLGAADALLVQTSVEAPVTVVGAVKRPNSLAAKTLGAAIIGAGGLRRAAETSGIFIRRMKRDLGPYRLPQDAEAALEPGDVVRVAARTTIDRVSIVGAVRAPGLIEIDESPTLAEAIEDAGGLIPNVPDLIIVVRSVVDPRRGRFVFNATDLKKPEVSEFVLHPNDLIEIGTRPRPRRPGP